MEAQRVDARPRGTTAWPRREGLALLRRQNLWRDALLRRMLALADTGTAILVALSFAAGAGSIDQAFWATVFLPAWIVLAKLHGLYDRDHRTLRHLTADEVPNIFMWALTATAGTTLFLAVAPVTKPDGTAVVRGLAMAALAAVILRGTTRFVWRRVVPRERTAVVGSGPLADATRRKLELFADIHADVVAELDEAEVARLRDSTDDLVDVDRIILASHAIDEHLIAILVNHCRSHSIKLSVVPPVRGMFGTAVRLTHVAELPVVEYNTWDVSRSTLFLKRALDVSVSAVALALLAPLLGLIALAVHVESRGGAIFAQTRVGLGGRPFRMWKFRTMVADAEARLPQLVSFDALREPMFKLPNDPRVTRVGRILRRTSLDELPQLLNVLKGDMSLVGPRPEQIELVQRYAPQHEFRLALKPGMTGPMQVFGRGRLTFEERLAVEREYAENLSIGRDLRILAMTLPGVVTGKGAY